MDQLRSMILMSMIANDTNFILMRLNSDMAQTEILDLCDQFINNLRNVVISKRVMKNVLNGVKSSFKWKRDEMSRQLFYVTKDGENDVLHPWIEVKPSDLTDQEKAEGYDFGLFASRTFEVDDVIGIYVGEIISDNELRNREDSVFEIKVGGRNLYVDISDTTEARLKFGMGMHMLNDLNYQGSDEKDNNNAAICGDLSVLALSEIKAGDEITTSYNFNN